MNGSHIKEVNFDCKITNNVGLTCSYVLKFETQTSSLPHLIVINISIQGFKSFLSPDSYRIILLLLREKSNPSRRILVQQIKM